VPTSTGQPALESDIDSIIPKQFIPGVLEMMEIDFTSTPSSLRMAGRETVIEAGLLHVHINALLYVGP
jgi:hypothetical protein